VRASHLVKRIARPLVRVAGGPVAAVVETWLRRSGLQAGIAVAYHSLADHSGEPATELVPPHAAVLYEAQLRHLTQRYRVVPAEELPSAVASRRRGERFPVAVTFDDDLGSHIERALPVLQRLEIRATFFLTGASLAGPFSFWWERLQRAVDAGRAIPALPGGALQPVAAPEIGPIGRAAENLEPEQRDAWSEQLLEAAGADPAGTGLSAAAVRRLVGAGQSIGFHTRRHDALTTLDDEQLAKAMRTGRDELEALAGTRLGVIGYPHGRADERVADAARAAAFDLGFTTAERAITPATPPFLLGRINPSYRSTGHFALQVVRALATAQR
jgi:peptidoglycan/xylan/chitin deacetylase (PgdA/CDA1 family)